MEKKRVSDWKDIFSFTFRQQIKTKSFKITTILIGLIAFIAVFLIFTISTSNFEKEEKEQNIDHISQVYILDKTGEFSDLNLYISPYSEFEEAHSDLKSISFTQIDSNTEVSNAMEDTVSPDDEILIYITREEDEVLVRGLLPENTNIPKDEAELLLDALIPVFEMNKVGQSGIPMDQLSLVLKPIITTFVAAGEEEKSMGEDIIGYFIPMIYSFVLYMLLLIYAQAIMNNLLIEKTSKLTEMLLTSARPKMIITGKILAMTLVAILQFMFWIACLVFGFLAGHVYLGSQFESFVNPVAEIIELVQNNTDGNAFSLVAIILSIVALSLGILFYFSFAGLVGASLSKAEDISSGTGVFYLSVVIFGMSAMMLPMFAEVKTVTFMNLFPLSSPFVLPASILNGSLGILTGLIGIGILIVSTIVTFILAGRLYKGLIFFKGEKLTIPNIVQVIKGVD